MNCELYLLEQFNCMTVKEVKPAYTAFFSEEDPFQATPLTLNTNKDNLVENICNNDILILENTGKLNRPSNTNGKVDVVMQHGSARQRRGALTSKEFY